MWMHLEDPYMKAVFEFHLLNRWMHNLHDSSLRWLKITDNLFGTSLIFFSSHLCYFAIRTLLLYLVNGEPITVLSPPFCERMATSNNPSLSNYFCSIHMLQALFGPFSYCMCHRSSDLGDGMQWTFNISSVAALASVVSKTTTCNGHKGTMALFV